MGSCMSDTRNTGEFYMVQKKVKQDFKTFLQFVTREDKFEKKIDRNDEILRSIDSADIKFRESDPNSGRRTSVGSVRVVSY